MIQNQTLPLVQQPPVMASQALGLQQLLHCLLIPAGPAAGLQSLGILPVLQQI